MPSSPSYRAFFVLKTNQICWLPTYALAEILNKKCEGNKTFMNAILPNQVPIGLIKKPHLLVTTSLVLEKREIFQGFSFSSKLCIIVQVVSKFGNIKMTTKLEVQDRIVKSKLTMECPYYISAGRHSSTFLLLQIMK